MSDRSDNGPILRKRGTVRRRPRDEARQDAGAGRVVIRRKIYDPKADGQSGSSSVSGDPARARKVDSWRREGPPPRGAATRVERTRGGVGGRPERGGRGRSSDSRGGGGRGGSRGPARGPGGKRIKPPEDPAKIALRAEATALAEDKGIPLVHAYRILKNQTTLNDVLKVMMRKERFDRLVEKDGIDRELAGQVASGHLSKQRALVLTRMRSLRKQKLHLDGIKTAEQSKAEVYVDFFDGGWVRGRVKVSRPYDFDFEPTDGGEVTTHFKHDAKAICGVDAYEAIQAAAEVDEEIRAAALSGTEDRSQRVRPDDAWLLELANRKDLVRFVTRDGEVLVGNLKAFGRWDLELVVGMGHVVTCFFHALHASGKRLGVASGR